MVAWQVEGDGGTWFDFSGQALEAVLRAQEAGHKATAYEELDFCYVVDFEARVQLNTNTGNARRIREAGMPLESREHGRIHLGSHGPPPALPPVESEQPAAAPAAKRLRPSPQAKAPTATVTAAMAPAARLAAADGGPAGKAAAIAPGSDNQVLADIFDEMGAIQKLKRDRFRAVAYGKAAQALRAHPEPILSGAQAKPLQGIGAGMARRIDVVLATGELEELKELRRDKDVMALRALRSVHGIGAVRAGNLVEKGVRSLVDLRKGIAAGNIHLDAVQTIGLKHADEFVVKIPRAEVQEHEGVLQEVRQQRHPTFVMLLCGSYRRGKAECGDIDVLVTSPAYTAEHKHDNFGGSIFRSFVQSLRDCNYLTDDLAAGNTKYMGVCRLPGVDRLHRRIDIRCIRHDQFHFGTLYFTGSAALSVRLRMRAIELGLRLSEYSLENQATKEQVPAESERDIFRALGVDYLEPHER